MHYRRLPNQIDDGQPRIERRVRILEDHLHLELPLARSGTGEAREGLPAPESRARRERQEPDREPTQRRFAAAGLADEADDLTFADGEIDAVDGMHHFLAQARPEDVGDPCGEVERPDELSRDGLELEQRHRHGQGCSPPATARSAMATYACSTA